MGHYENLSSPPQDALRKIEGNPRLKGKTDINPQWRYEALTREFGECGTGWRVEIVDTKTEPIPDTHELMLFVQVNLYVKDGESWSEPIPGFGGDFLIKKDKNGIHGNDEAYKMATTDAIGTAAKMIGVAADVYRGKLNGASDSKYSRYDAPQQAQQQSPSMEAGALAKKLMDWARAEGLENNDVSMMIKEHYGKGGWKELSIQQQRELGGNPAGIWQKVMQKLGDAA